MWTENEASETVPFLYYMIRNVVVLLLLTFLFMIVDYARIRMVADDRTSALASTAAGAHFAGANIVQTYGLYLLLTAIAVVLVTAYAVIEKSMPQESYWPLLFLFVLQQCYVLARLWLKAGFYASQIALYRSITTEEHLRSVSVVPSTT
jgi:hypothetical protein